MATEPLSLNMAQGGYEKGTKLIFEPFQHNYLYLKKNGIFKEETFNLEAPLITGIDGFIICHLLTDTATSLFKFSHMENGKEDKQKHMEFLDKWASFNHLTLIDTSEIPYLKALANELQGYWWSIPKKLLVSIKEGLAEKTLESIKIQKESGTTLTKAQVKELKPKANEPLLYLVDEGFLEDFDYLQTSKEDELEFYFWDAERDSELLAALPKCTLTVDKPTVKTSSKRTSYSQKEIILQRLEGLNALIEESSFKQITAIAEKLEVHPHDVVAMLLS